MADLLNNPAVQAGFAPFLLALIVMAILLKPLPRLAAGIALVAGVFATMYLINLGWTFPPRSSSQKIVVLAVAALPIGIVLNVLPSGRRVFAALAGLLGAAAVVWLVWPVLARREGQELWLSGGGAILWGAWICAALDTLEDNPTRALGAVPALGFGVGGCALLGASASLGQLGIALGAAACAAALLLLITQRIEAGRMLTFSAGLLAAVIGYGAMVYAKLPWFSLLPLGLIPLLAHLPLGSRIPPRLQLFVVGVVTLVAAGVALFLTWKTEGGVPI